MKRMIVFWKIIKLLSRLFLVGDWILMCMFFCCSGIGNKKNVLEGKTFSNIKLESTGQLAYVTSLGMPRA